MNRENLKILSDGLLGLIDPIIPTMKVEFTMSVFSKEEFCGAVYDPILDISHCGSAGCAVGWAPFFGIKKSKEESFRDYSRRVFDLSFMSDEWQYMFASDWTFIDNTKEGAGLRIKYVLEKGLPSNWKGQLYSGTSLSYIN